MKRLLAVLATSALFVTLAAVASAQDAKDKDAPPKAKDDKAAPAKEKSDKDAAPAKPAEALKQTPYYPLQVGNTWSYRIGDNRYTLKVAKFEKIGDINCARVEMLLGEENKVASVEHIGVTAEGVVRAAFDEKVAAPPVMFLKLPPSKDATWKVDSVIGKTDKSPGEKVVGTFTMGEEKITVGGVNYDVVTSSARDFEANGMKLSFTYYFAKDIGMVKQVIDIAGQKVTIELEKFEAGKPQ
jgi:hypothetical protein